MPVFSILQATFEAERVTLVEGPGVPDWKAFCDSLIPEATRRALAGRSDWIVDWDDIVNALTALLVERGYRRVEPATVEYPWSSSPTEPHPALPSDLLDAIDAHNRRVPDPVRRKPDDST